MLGEPYLTSQYYNSATDAEEQSLSMLVGPAGFMYAVFSAGFEVVREIGHVHLKEERVSRIGNELAAIIDNFGLVARKFEKVYAAFQTPTFVMLPEAYAVENAARPLLKFTSGAEPSRASLSHHLGTVQLTFEPPPSEAAEIERLFSQALIRHSGAVNISLLMQHPSLSATDVLMTETDRCLELCAKRGNELLYYNLFEPSGNEDILYYLLYMMEQHGISPADAALSVSCQREANDPLIRELKKYVKHTSLVNAGRQTLKRGGEIAALPEHYYFTLLQQHTCEL